LFWDLIYPQERAEGERLFRELFERQRDSFQIDSQMIGANSRPVRWTAWLVPGTNANSDYALALAEDTPHDHEAAQRLRQAEKLEAVGRLAGGVAHDFNNLLTGVLLYCDLLMAGLEPGHQVRKYAEEIRNAGMQATGLVRQLLAVARPANSEPRLLSLNEIAEGMRNLLVRLIGENIDLQFYLDPNLGLIKMDPTQSQQILLNLVLNARDAMPGGGQITVETSNCKVQVLTETSLGESSPTSLPARFSWWLTTGAAWMPLRALICSKLFHHEGRQGHRARIGDGLRHRDPQRRPDPCGQRAGVRHARNRHAPYPVNLPCLCLTSQGPPWKRSEPSTTSRANSGFALR
jgi:hypothetical protein